MPHSQYIPASHPPTAWDRILANPFGVSFGLMALILGPTILVSVIGDIEVSRSLADAGDGKKVNLGILFTLGAPISLYGIFNPGQRFSDLRAMIIELIGNIPLSFGALSFALGVAGSGNRYAIVTVVVTLAVGAGYALRAWGLFKSEKRSREHLERRPTTEE